METRDFYAESKFCRRCRDYVRFLQSLEGAYCVECGAKVRLFSREDYSKFLLSLSKKKDQGPAKEKRVS